MHKEEIINKTMDLEDLNSERALQIVDELNDLIKALRSKNLKISSWYGSFNLSGDPLSNERINRDTATKASKAQPMIKIFPGFCIGRSSGWF